MTGAFTVTMESIRKVPQETWQSIKDSLSRRDNVEEGHFIGKLVWYSFIHSFYLFALISINIFPRTSLGCITNETAF